MEERIKEIVDEAIKEYPELFLVAINLKGNVGNQKLLVFVDGDTGVNIDNCGSISRKVGNTIEEEDLIQGKYTLEVSSPGLDFPLLLPRQYPKHIGRTFSIVKRNEEKLEGKLKEVKETGILIETKKEELEVNFDEIDKASVVVSFK